AERRAGRRDIQRADYHRADSAGVARREIQADERRGPIAPQLIDLWRGWRNRAVSRHLADRPVAGAFAPGVGETKYETAHDCDSRDRGLHDSDWTGVSAAGHGAGESRVPAPGERKPDSGEREDRWIRTD